MIWLIGKCPFPFIVTVGWQWCNILNNFCPVFIGLQCQGITLTLSLDGKVSKRRCLPCGHFNMLPDSSNLCQVCLKGEPCLSSLSKVLTPISGEGYSELREPPPGQMIRMQPATVQKGSRGCWQKWAACLCLTELSVTPLTIISNDIFMWVFFPLCLFPQIPEALRY